MTQTPRRRRRELGQSIAILAGGGAAFLIMVGLVIDGGNAFVQQRRAQNAADAASEAGAVELARRMVGLPGSDAEWDARVLAAVNAVSAANDLTTIDTPQYTDRDGVVLGDVGTGSIPGATQGVLAGGTRDFDTYFAGILGLTGFRASATANAITGYAQDSGVGGLIPLTFPVILTQCETGGGSNRLYHPLGNEEWPVGPSNPVAIPLCSNGPGNVGWIDWTPPGGGASEVAASIRNPNNPPITTKKWYYTTETGQITSLDDDMDTWEGKDIMFPIFHAQADDPLTVADETEIGTCDATPLNDQRDLNDCPAGQIGFSGGRGWYYLVTFAEFHLQHSYIQDNHEAECNDPALASIASAGSGNQLNNCLIGYFKSPVIAGEFSVGGTTSDSKFTPVAIQLIK
jgi:Putative Flp pilus-assembly TadE/G-like